MRWSIYCSVIDNFGDLGVSLRLAVQLAAEGHGHVDLVVDDASTLARFKPTLDEHPDLPLCIRGPDTGSPDGVPDVLIQAFGAPLPDQTEERLAHGGHGVGPVWVTLEYLSAEPWIERFHLAQSPHPRSGKPRWFYFPGFTAASGGLLRESGLADANRRWSARDARSMLSRVTGREQAGLPVMLFVYHLPPSFLSWLGHWQTELGNAVIVAETGVLNRISETLDASSLSHVPRSSHRFLSQREFDRLLWSCALNVVRGEDSFVRAQFAGRPFLWQIYPQADNAHVVKLDAFLALYGAGLEPETFAAIREAFYRLNGIASEPAPPLSQKTWRRWEEHAIHWRDRLSAQADLVSRLSGFVADPVKTA